MSFVVSDELFGDNDEAFLHNRKHFIVLHCNTNGACNRRDDGKHAHLITPACQNQFGQHTDTDTMLYHRDNRRVIDIGLRDERLDAVLREDRADIIVKAETWHQKLRAIERRDGKFAGMAREVFGQNGIKTVLEQG